MLCVVVLCCWNIVVHGQCASVVFKLMHYITRAHVRLQYVGRFEHTTLPTYALILLLQSTILCDVLSVNNVIDCMIYLNYVF